MRPSRVFIRLQLGDGGRSISRLGVLFFPPKCNVSGSPNLDFRAISFGAAFILGAIALPRDLFGVDEGDVSSRHGEHMGATWSTPSISPIIELVL